VAHSGLLGIHETLVEQRMQLLIFLSRLSTEGSPAFGISSILNNSVYTDVVKKALGMVGITLCVNFVLEKRKARLGYLQKLAERQLDAYWQITGILSTQVFQVHCFVQAFERHIKNPTKEGFEEIRNFLRKFADACSNDQSKILQNSFLLSPTIISALAQHQDSLEHLSIAANPAQEIETQYQNARKISATLRTVMAEVSNEVRRRRCPV
jgi:hypothetical protein